MNVFTGLVLAALATVGASESQDVQKKADSEPATSAQTTKATRALQVADNDTQYKIGPQDVLRIDVWKETEITRTVPVRPDGKISLPLLNDIQAVGLTPMQLANAISEGLKKFITAPQVTVSVSEINSRRVFVTGEVTRPGTFPLLPDMTVLQALSSSGGFTQFAKMKKIYILRTESGRQVKHSFNYKEAVDGKNPEQNILLEPGDVIVVP